MDNAAPIESHPWPPFLPSGAEYLVMGTFPPAAKRWSMEFFYPNPINDFWRIMGLIFMGDKDALWDADARAFDLEKIKQLLTEHGIAMSDTGSKVRRLMGNASDKFLEIVEPVDLAAVLRQLPSCTVIATTGEKAADVLAAVTGTTAPKMGECVTADFDLGPGHGTRRLRIWRMPSTSRAYPMKMEKKAEYYKRMFE